MSPKRLGELDAVRLLRARLSKNSAPGVVVGIGDDAAVLEAGSGVLVWTVDACLEGTHFERPLLSLGDVAWKALHAAASDLAAMGAKPLGALSALELPPRFSKRDLDDFARGQALSARALGCPIVGGNIARGERLGVTTTVLGLAKQPLRRDGARPGDEVWLVGEVGLAAAGFALLRSGRRAGSAAVRRAIAAWRRPQALVREAQALVGRARAAIDISDGLGGDVSHLAEASGVRVVLEEKAVLRALPRELTQVAPLVRQTPLELALRGGEDYALVATGPAAKRPRGAKRIGRVERVEKDRGGVLEQANGRVVALPRGFEH